MEKASDVEYTLAVNGHGCMDLQCEAILSLGSCPRRFRLLASDELQQHSNTLLRFLDTATDRRHNVLRLGDPLAIATERTRHGGIITGNIGGAEFLGRYRHHAQLHRHAEIVQ